MKNSDPVLRAPTLDLLLQGNVQLGCALGGGSTFPGLISKPIHESLKELGFCSCYFKELKCNFLKKRELKCTSYDPSLVERTIDPLWS